MTGGVCMCVCVCMYVFIYHISYHIISYHIISYHIIYHVMSFHVIPYYLVLEKSVTIWRTIYRAQQCVDEFRTEQARRGENRSTIVFSERKNLSRSWVVKILAQFKQNCLSILKRIFISCSKDWVWISVRISASLIAIFLFFSVLQSN